MREADLLQSGRRRTTVSVQSAQFVAFPFSMQAGEPSSGEHALALPPATPVATTHPDTSCAPVRNDFPAIAANSDVNAAHFAPAAHGPDVLWATLVTLIEGCLSTCRLMVGAVDPTKHAHPCTSTEDAVMVQFGGSVRWLLSFASGSGCRTGGAGGGTGLMIGAPAQETPAGIGL